MACATCPSPCGKGIPGKSNSDPVKQALCVIFCETRKEICEGKHKGKTKSAVAKEKAAKSKALDRAISRKYGSGATKALEKMRLVPFKGAPSSWKRMALKADELAKHLQPLKDKLIKEGKEKLIKMGVKKAATSWMKLVPVLNVLSTAYDLYDIATTGYDLYKSIDDALSKYSGDVYRINPDIAIEGKAGDLKDIYDFKFDGDRWRQGQRELYDESLRQSGNPNPNVEQNGEISQKTCECDGVAKIKAVPGV
jgi:hypothetical protein